MEGYPHTALETDAHGGTAGYVTRVQAFLYGVREHDRKQGNCDGAVTVDTWGCGPALVAESLLRHQREIPMLFVRTDGTPINERRLAGFAFRLRSKPPRRVVEPASSPSRS
jgi:hypothetical protein